MDQGGFRLQSILAKHSPASILSSADQDTLRVSCGLLSPAFDHSAYCHHTRAPTASSRAPLAFLHCCHVPLDISSFMADCWFLSPIRTKGRRATFALWPHPPGVPSCFREGLVFYFLVLGHCNPGIKIGIISMLRIRLCIFVPLPLIIPILVPHFLESRTCWNPPKADYRIDLFALKPRRRRVWSWSDLSSHFLFSLPPKVCLDFLVFCSGSSASILPEAGIFVDCWTHGLLCLWQKALFWLALEAPPINRVGKLEWGITISAKLGEHLSLEPVSNIHPWGSQL